MNRNKRYLQELRQGYARHSGGATHIDAKLQKLHLQRLALRSKADELVSQMLLIDNEIKLTSEKYHSALDQALKYHKLMEAATPGKRGGSRPHPTYAERQRRIRESI